MGKGETLSLLPGFQPWSFCLFYLLRSESQPTHAHLHTHTLREPGIPSSWPPRPPLPPRAPSLRTSLTRAPETHGVTETKCAGPREGRRLPWPPSVHQLWSCSGPRLSLFPSCAGVTRPRLPSLRHGDRQGAQTGRRFGDVEALGGGGGVLRTPGHPESPGSPRPAPPQARPGSGNDQRARRGMASRLHVCPRWPALSTWLEWGRGGRGGRGPGACSAPRGSWGGVDSSL